MTDRTHKFDVERREHAEPRELTAPVPWAVLTVFAGVFAWCVWFIATSNISKDPALGDGRTAAALAAPPAHAADGGQIFATQCAACHQPTGAGIPGVFPPLAGSEWVVGKERLVVQIVLHGLTGSIAVKGTTYASVMPPFGDKLSDEEIAAVATYVRGAWGNGASALDPKTVQAERSATHDHAQPWQGGDELAQLQ